MGSLGSSLVRGPQIFLLKISELQSIPCVLWVGQGLKGTFQDSHPVWACSFIWKPEDPDQLLAHSLSKPWLTFTHGGHRAKLWEGNQNLWDPILSWRSPQPNQEVKHVNKGLFTCLYDDICHTCRHPRSMLGGGSVKGGPGCWRKPGVWNLLEDSPEEVMPPGSVGRAGIYPVVTTQVGGKEGSVRLQGQVCVLLLPRTGG